MSEPDRKHEENLQNFKKIDEKLEQANNIMVDHMEEDKLTARKFDDKFLKLEDATEKQNETLGKILIHVKETNEFMANMSGLNDLVRGASLLKKPILWFLGLILGIVALFGGLKVIGAWLIAQATR